MYFPPTKQAVRELRRLGVPRPAPPLEPIGWGEAVKLAIANPEESYIYFVRPGESIGSSPKVESVTSLADLSPEELESFREASKDQRDDPGIDPEGESRSVPLSVDQKLRLAEMMSSHAKQFAKTTHFRDSAPRSRKMDMSIRLKDESLTTHRRPPRRLTPDDFAELQKQVEILIKAGMIVPSDSPFGAPILFVPKPGGKRRFAVDYRELNDMTIRDVTPLPRVDDLLQHLEGASVFSKLDATWMFWQLRLNPEDAHKTGMVTPLGHFHWKVVPFGLTNAPGHCMRVMSEILAPFLYKTCMVLLDDIIIYSKSVEEHMMHLEEILAALAAHHIFMNPDKCEFLLSRMSYLGHVVSTEGIGPQKSKLEAVKHFPVPTTITEVRGFLGLTGYYRKLIKDFSSISAPLSDMTKGNATGAVSLDTHQLAAFVLLRETMLSAPLLRLINPLLPFVLQTDASNFALGAVLMQHDGDVDRLWPVGYFSKKLPLAQQRYTVTARELLAIVESFRFWRFELVGARGGLTVYCDHRPLSWIRSVEPLGDMHARWLNTIEEMTFSIVHKPGTEMGPADAFSRRADHADPETKGAALKGKPIHAPEDIESIPLGMYTGQKLNKEEIPRMENPGDLILACLDLTQGNDPEYLGAVMTLFTDLKPSIFAVTKNRGRKDSALPTPDEILEDEVEAWHTESQKLVSRLLAEIKFMSSSSPVMDRAKEGNDTSLSVRGGLVIKSIEGRNKIFVPDDTRLRDKIVGFHHDGPEAGHVGSRKTLEKVSRGFWWPGMGESVDTYVKRCSTCQRSKRSTQKPHGNPSPFFAPESRWETITMDECGGLPLTSRGMSKIWVFVDKLTKRLITVPLHEGNTAEDLTHVFLDRVVQHHGLPRKLVSDRDPRLASVVFQTMLRLWNVRSNMSTANHPQTDGQSESSVGTVVQMLRAFVGYNGADWDLFLPAVTFAYNDSIHPSTGFTPFELDTGGHPATPASMLARDLSAEVSAAAREQTAAQFVSKVNSNIQRARIRLDLARIRYEKNMTKLLRPADFQIGDLVYLNWAGAGKVGEPLGKLRPQWLGPFRIIDKRYNNAFRLELPRHMRIHNVVNARFLKKHVASVENAPEVVTLSPAVVVKILAFRISIDSEGWHRMEFQVVTNPVDVTTSGWLSALQVAELGGFALMLQKLENEATLSRKANHHLGMTFLDKTFTEGAFQGLVSSFDPIDARTGNAYEIVYEDADSRWITDEELVEFLSRRKPR